MKQTSISCRIILQTNNGETQIKSVLRNPSLIFKSPSIFLSPLTPKETKMSYFPNDLNILSSSLKSRPLKKILDHSRHIAQMPIKVKLESQRSLDAMKEKMVHCLFAIFTHATPVGDCPTLEIMWSRVKHLSLEVVHIFSFLS